MNYRNIGLIHLLFPYATILHLVRDPMDTLYSCYSSKHSFAQNSRKHGGIEGVKCTITKGKGIENVNELLTREWVLFENNFKFAMSIQINALLRSIGQFHNTFAHSSLHYHLVKVREAAKEVILRGHGHWGLTSPPPPHLNGRATKKTFLRLFNM